MFVKKNLNEKKMIEKDILVQWNVGTIEYVKNEYLGKIFI